MFVHFLHTEYEQPTLQMYNYTHSPADVQPQSHVKVLLQFHNSDSHTDVPSL